MKKIFHSNFLSVRPIEKAMAAFSENTSTEKVILDIGCGKKPYKHLFSCKYIGLDNLKSVHPDIVSKAWEIPLRDNSVDGVVLNQSLEHIAETNGTINEIARILKPNGTGIISVPQTMRIHSDAHRAEEAPVKNFSIKAEPYWRVDYFRFTKYGLIYYLKPFKIMSLTQTNGYGSAILQLCNYFLASLHIPYLFTPIYLINNILGLFLDNLAFVARKVGIPGAEKFYHYVYSTLTINYIIVFKNNPLPPHMHSTHNQHGRYARSPGR